MSTHGANATVIEPLLDGRYRLHDELGRGAHGVVHRATDERIGREVAIKILKREGPGARERFVREAQAVAAIGHPAIVPIFDLGTTPGGAPFIVMERQQGEALDVRIARDGALSVVDAVAVALEIGEALEAAHAVGLVHRDVKPANIMLTPLTRGRLSARLLDFGLALLLERDERLTADGVVVGSPAYVPPERLRGEPPDPRGDIYGLALVLYEALAGAPAFDAPSPVALRAKILTTDPGAIESRRGDVPPTLAAALARALAKDPGARHASMHELLEALRASARSPEAALGEPPTSASGPRSGAREVGASRVAAPRAPLNALPPSTEIGGTYRLLRQLGSGGMAVVYEALDTTLGRRVALKLARGGVDVDRLAFARLEREARAAASLGHPNIVGVLDVGVDVHHGAYVAMELLTGESLLQRLRRQGPLAVDDAVDIMLEVLDGLAAAHAVGMVHRDIKPANLWLVPLARGTDLVKILDFGVVKLREEGESPKLTLRGVAIGTPAYMAPEQLRLATVDARADVFAVGATLHQAIVGRLAAPVDGATPEGGAEAARSRDVSAVPDVAVRAVIARAVASDPADRYPDAAAMRDALAATRPRRRAVPDRSRGEDTWVDRVEPSTVPTVTAVTVNPVPGRPPASGPPSTSFASSADGPRENRANSRSRSPLARRALGAAATLLTLAGGAAAWRAGEPAADRDPERAPPSGASATDALSAAPPSPPVLAAEPKAIPPPFAELGSGPAVSGTPSAARALETGASAATSAGELGRPTRASQLPPRVSSRTAPRAEPPRDPPAPPDPAGEDLPTIIDPFP